MIITRDHVPNSSGERVLVTTSIKIRLVNALTNPTTKPIRPEYVTLILLLNERLDKLDSYKTRVYKDNRIRLKFDWFCYYSSTINQEKNKPLSKFI